MREQEKLQQLEERKKQSRQMVAESIQKQEEIKDDVALDYNSDAGRPDDVDADDDVMVSFFFLLMLMLPFISET
jgi:hypothetical protein